MQEKLYELGFTKNEARVYETLCNYESLTGHELAKKSGIDRSVTYNLLSNLLKKGVVGSTVKGSKKEFFITDPKNLLREIQMRQSIAEDLIKEVSEKSRKKEKKTIIETYSGMVGARKFYSLVESHNDSVFYTYGGNGKMIKKIELYLSHYKKIFQKKASVIKFLMPKKYKHGNIFREIKNTKLKKTNMDLHDASCSIIGDYVVLHIYEDEPEQIMIKSKALSDMMKDFFEYSWSKTK